MGKKTNVIIDENILKTYHWKIILYLLVLLWICLSILSCSKDECREEKKENCAVTFEINPVCGCNGVTYENPSTAECNGIKDYTMGSCN